MANTPVRADSACDNVIPFQRHSNIVGYAPGVIPFDSTNPSHVQAWNALFQLGWSDQRFRERELMERATSLECVK